MTDNFLDIVGLQTYKTKYDKEIKAYIKNQGVGLTTEDVKQIIDESVNGIQISDDKTYEPLEEV